MATVQEALAKKQALCKEYFGKIKKRIQTIQSGLTTAQRDFLFGQQYGVKQDTTIYFALKDAMNRPETVVSEYITEQMGWMFEEMIYPRNKDVLLYFADRLRDYPYMTSYDRRSFRSRNNGVYVDKLMQIIRDLSSLHGAPALDVPPADILNGNLPEDQQAYHDEYTAYSEWQIAYALDHGDTAVEEAVTRILTEENGSGRMTAELVRGVLFSRRSEFHELLGKLLLAAKLQEGLRQVICENADYGTKEGFLAILKVIAENNLIRFSAVKRAVGTWMGWIADDSHDLERISTKSLELIIACLEDESVRRECLASEDAMKLYIALWSYGVDDIETAVALIAALSAKGSDHQLFVAGYFTSQIQLKPIANSIAKRVVKAHPDKDNVLAVWLPNFMEMISSELWDCYRHQQPFSYEKWFSSKDELCEYYALFKQIIANCKGKSKHFAHTIFPWYVVTLSKAHLANRLCAMAILSREMEKIDEAVAMLKELDNYDRNVYFTMLLHDPKNDFQRKTVLETLSERDTYFRKCAYEIAVTMTLTTAEYRLIEDYLRFKSSDVRQYVLELLQKQNDNDLCACIKRLLASNKEECRLGGLDLLSQIKKDDARCNLADQFTETLLRRAQADNLPTKEKILLDALLPAPAETEFTQAALFTPADKYIPDSTDQAYADLCADLFAEYFPESNLPGLIRSEKGNNAPVTDAPCSTAVSAAEDLQSLSRFIDLHKTDSYIDKWGETILLCNIRDHHLFVDENGKPPLPQLWKEWAEQNSLTPKRLLRAWVLSAAYAVVTKYSEISAPLIQTVYGSGFQVAHALPYARIMETVLADLSAALPREDATRLASAVAVWFIRCVSDDQVMIYSPDHPNMPRMYETYHLLAHKQLQCTFGNLLSPYVPDLQHTFPLSVAVANRCMDAQRNIPKEENVGHTIHLIPAMYEERLLKGDYYRSYQLTSVKEYIRAAYYRIITKEQLFEFLMDPANLYHSLQFVSAIASAHYEKGKQITSNGNQYRAYKTRVIENFLGHKNDPTDEDLSQIRYVVELYETLIPHVLASELRRGDSPAAYSKAIRSIMRVYGAHYLAEILSAMGNDTIVRSTYVDTNDRKGSLSYLLSICIPTDEDSADTLRKELAGKQISAKRLIEAALYSPEWIPLVGEYLGIDSFEAVCYYFIAHMNEKFDDKRKAIIAKFTPLSEEELNMGAFDVNWFRSAYNSIGEREFDLIYDAAKYITDGIKHSRARKYADAALGKIDTAQTEVTISDKRNKDLLMAYALIPIAHEDDLCKRYLYIQRFKKESKQFGSQRVASEGKAVEMALTNLAINAGYSDTMRLTLQMETKVIDDSRALLEEQIIEDVSFRITLDENGKASLIPSKGGKTLKSVPAKLKKNAQVVELTEFVKILTEQYRRTRVMLERAMEDSTAFTFSELSALSAHPVVYPMLKNLVLISGDTVGFLAEDGLADDTGRVQPLDDTQWVKIAHPFDLYSHGCWRAYQRYLYEQQIAQPFRQVFRELYIKTDEELELFHSLRYAGNQIQPAKTVATLKSRRWVADVEDGLQKVYYKENIVAQIYAMADWFSPADIEAPTLEWVSFTDRKTGKELKIADIPDIVFSEVMRDVDLAVSVAHAGGVDPETSHSTMELRGAILSYVLPMFGMDNVQIDARHAIIRGKLGEYSVHLGSGVVHQIGGAMIPVLPVHSQHRGKIFLPFVDDDPKTAEIISKVLLFAEDSKIKDPTILSAIQK